MADDIKRVQPDFSGTHLLFDSAGSETYFNQQKAEENKLAGQRMDDVSKIINELGAPKKSTDLGIWSQMKGASEFNIYGQRALESLLGVRANESLIAYDIESLGTPTKMRKTGSADFFSPTEIALHKGKYTNGKLALSPEAKKSLSLLVQPDVETENALRGAIKQLKTTGWMGMSEDMRRSLVDLTAYSGDVTKQFEKKKLGGTSYTNVKEHAEKIAGNASLGTKDAISRMEEGLNNLVKHGTPAKDAIKVLDQFVPNKRGQQDPVRFVGYNTYNYDEPALTEFFNKNKEADAPESKINKALSRLEKGINNPENIDLFHALKTVTDNPYNRFGTDMTLSNVHSVFGFDKEGSAHHGLFDVSMTADIFQKVNADVRHADREVQSKSKVGKVETLKQNMVESPYYWNKSTLKAGQQIYAFNGLPSYQAGDYDGVFENKEGKLEKQYDLKQNPVYARTSYKIDTFFKDVEINKQVFQGVQLSTDEGQSHVLFRNTKEELAQTLQSHFIPVGRGGIDKETAQNLQNEDRALRRYEKMFSVGTGSDAANTGYNLMKRMYTNLDEIKGLSWEEGVGKLQKEYKGSNWMTNSYIRDLGFVKTRLEAEEKIWKPFMDNAGLLPTNAEKTIALRSYRDEVQKEVGTNKVFMESGGEPLFSVKVGDKTSTLRGFDRASTVRTLRSTVEGKGSHVIRPNRGELKNRFDELVENNLIPAFEKAGDKKVTRKMRKIQNDFHKEVMANNKVSAIYEEMASMIGEYMGMNSDVLGGYEREAVSTLSGPYKAALEDFKPKQSTIDKAIQSSSYYGKTLNQVTNNEGLKPFFESQKKSIDFLLSKSGLEKNQPDMRIYDRKMFDKMRDMEGKVKQLADTYMKNGFRVQLFHDDKKGLSMGIMDANAPEGLAREGYEGLRKSNNAAVVHLPFYGENGKIRWRNQEHLNRFVGNINNKGVLSVNTMLDETINSLIGSASRFKESYEEKQALGEKDFFIRMQSQAEKKVQKILERSPMDYNLGFSEKKDMFEVRSNRANFNRSMTMDTHKFAESWYREQYNKLSSSQRQVLGFHRNADEIANSLESGKTFFESMHFNAKSRFLSQVDQWAESKYGLNLSAHGVNDRQLSKGYRSLLGGDPRMQSAFAAFDPTSGENRLKSLNYIGLDKENVTQALKANGETDAMIDLRTRYGTTTRLGNEVKGDEVDGISMRTAYMDDQQIATSVARNKEQLQGALKEMLSEGEISPDEYTRYNNMIKDGRISTYEGMSVMSSDFKSAFDITRDVRERLQTGYEMDEKLKAAITNHAQKLGVEFDVQKSINFEDLGKTMSIGETASLMDKNGMLTVGRMAIDETQTQSYKANNKEVFIKGWDADNQMLLLGHEQRGDESMKTVTTTGRRHTETFLPQKLVEIVAEQEGVEAIVPEFGTSKRMGGAKLEEKVRVYEDELLRQVHGQSKASPEVESFLKKHDITVGSNLIDNTVETNALNELLVPKLRTHLNMDESDIQAENGRIVVDENIGFTKHQEGISPKGIEALDTEMGKTLDYQFRKDGIEYSQVIKQRHDVWADQFAVGKDVPEGRVRVGLRELDALRKHASEVVPEAKDYVSFLEREVGIRGRQSTRDVGQYVMNAMANGDVPKSGDIVFDTGVTKPEIEGQVNAKMGEDGILRVNPDSAAPMPQITAKDTKIFSDEYAQTLLDTGRIQVGYEENGEIKTTDVKAHLTDTDMKYQGTAYLKLPDNSFDKEYMPLVDFENIGRKVGDTSYLNELQKTQRNIVEDVAKYNKLGSTGTVEPERLSKMKQDIVERTNRNMNNLQSQMASFLTSGQDSSLLNNTANARLDMSGHFRAQGVNPFMSYGFEDGQWKSKGTIKENVAYLNQGDLKTMITGAEDNILKAWHGKEGVPSFKSSTEKLDYILANVNEKGLYGSTIRYPIIDASTIQTMKYETADWVDPKAMYVGIGSTDRIAGDFDGDVFAGLLTGYKDDKAAVYHSALEKLHGKEQASSEARGREIMEDLTSNLRQELTDAGKSESEIQATFSALGDAKSYTVQDLSKEGLDEKTIEGIQRAKTTTLDNIETVIARTGKEYIGHIDNARQRISALHGITQGVLKEEGLISGEEYARNTALVDEVTRRLSQDSISSKKFTVQNLTREGLSNMEIANLRNEKLSTLRTELYNPDMDIEKTIGVLKDIDVIKDKEVSFESGVGQQRVFSGMKDEEFFRQGLEQIKRTNQMNSDIGGYQAAALRIGASAGTEDVKAMIQTGAGYAPTGAVRKLQENASEEVQQRFERYENAYRAGVVRQHQQNLDAEEMMAESREGASKTARSVLNDEYIEKKASARFSDVVGKMMPERINTSGVGAGAAAGALAFGAMWATSALMKKAPTPEGLQEQQQGPAVPVDKLLTSPTARVVDKNSEYINLQIKAKDARNMSSADIAAMVNQEVQSMASVQMDMNLNVNDNSQTIDAKWLQDVVANAMGTGYAFGN